MSLRRKLLGNLNRFRRKVVREKLPAENIAAGWALGMFIGCSVPFGLQLVIALPLAMMMRVSKLGATLGTFITNPVTIFFIYPAQTFVMNRLLFGGTLTFSRLMEVKWTWRAVRRLGAEVMASFFLGGFALAIILTPVTYFAIKALVTGFRARRESRQAGASPESEGVSA